VGEPAGAGVRTSRPFRLRPRRSSWRP
jgi:hypothetical protein